MMRSPTIPWIAAALGALSVLGYAYVTRGPSREATSSMTPTHASPVTPRGIAASTSTAPDAATATSGRPESAPTVAKLTNDVADVPTVHSRATIEKWIVDTTSPDPQTRADAIAALANAPKSEALPVLKNVLETGEPEVDRQVALRSLHTLALRDGDASGSIRDVLRGAQYHGGDESVSESAAALIEDLDSELALRSAQN
jgi:HEAT repeat protein